MTYNEAMLIALQSSDGNMEDVDRIAQSLMCKVDKIAECETSDEERWQMEHCKGWYEYY